MNLIKGSHRFGGSRSLRSVAACAVLYLAMSGAVLSAKSVDEFLSDVDRLKAKGIGAVWAPERKELQRTVEAVSANYRARLAAQRAQGQTPDSCPPPKGKVGIGGKQFISELRSLQPQVRRGEFSEAFALLMRRHYPCD